MQILAFRMDIVVFWIWGNPFCLLFSTENECWAQNEVDAIADRGEQRGGGHRDADPRQQVVQLPFNATRERALVY